MLIEYLHYTNELIMAKHSKGQDILPEIMRKTLAHVGNNIRIARKRRKIPLREMSQRTMVSIPTLQKIETGSPTVSMGIFLQVLWTLQLHSGFENIADPADDVIGNRMEKDQLPTRVHPPKNKPNLDF